MNQHLCSLHAQRSCDARLDEKHHDCICTCFAKLAIYTDGSGTQGSKEHSLQLEAELLAARNDVAAMKETVTLL